jgi:molybdate transport system ATP-binding protein
MRDVSEGELNQGIQAKFRQVGPIPLDAALSVAAGELLALIGPSGGGKSTILRAIAGLYRPREGHVACAREVWFDTKAGVHVPPQHRRVGLVFQHYVLFPHMTARGNVAAALGHLPRAKRAGRVNELLALVGLSDLADRRPAALSGGQQQRIAVARALARDPAVLLLDEPFSAVDQSTRRRLRHELATLRNVVRIPMVLVTHDLEEATALADRMVVLSGGRTIQSGAPADIMARPATLEVAQVVDLQNVFEGEILGHLPAEDATLLNWRGLTLRCGYQPEFAKGTLVTWTIPPGAVALHPDHGAAQVNVIAGRIAELVVLPGIVRVVFFVRDDPAAALVFPVPRHFVGHDQLQVGQPGRIALMVDAIHLMRS